MYNSITIVLIDITMIAIQIGSIWCDRGTPNTVRVFITGKCTGNITWKM